MTYFFNVFFGFVFILIVSLGLILTPLRKHVSRKLIVVAVFSVPPILLVTTLCVSQFIVVGVDGFLAGDFLCSSLHGGGSHRCDLGGAFFDAFVVASLFSLASFGLVPLAIFVVILVVFSTYKMLVRPV
ncbi:MAG TPA: hypothetical protein VL091_03730 [Marinobacter sp.]|nr:hypothetical protein [Marinobacter sp.]